MEAFPGVTGASTPITPGKQCLGVYLRGVCGLELLAPDLEVCQARRWCEVEGRAGRRRQGSGPMVAGGSRKIVNSDWREVDEGHLPVPYRLDGSLKNRLTYLFLVDCYLRYDHMWWCAGGVPTFPSHPCAHILPNHTE